MPSVLCELCPKHCLVDEGQSGECRIRVNIGGKLLAVTYGHPCSVNLDPVEKKPLFHFLPGTKILSIATVGCNLHCKNCQNWEISQANPEDSRAHKLMPTDLVAAAGKARCRSIAYTYTDPSVYYEYTLDSCRLARETGLNNVLVTAGYINTEPLKRLCKYVDAANIDLKALSDKFYRDICMGTLLPVQKALVTAKAAGVLVEVTNLVIPTLNDSDDDLRKLCCWVAKEMGKNTPLHFSSFFPRYRMKNLPPTPPETLDRAMTIAKDEGLQYVYIGNIQRRDGSTTFCPACKTKLVERIGYTIVQNQLKNGICPKCKTDIYGKWQ